MLGTFGPKSLLYAPTSFSTVSDAPPLSISHGNGPKILEFNLLAIMKTGVGVWNLWFQNIISIPFPIWHSFRFTTTFHIVSTRTKPWGFSQNIMNKDLDKFPVLTSKFLQTQHLSLDMIIIRLGPDRWARYAPGLFTHLEWRGSGPLSLLIKCQQQQWSLDVTSSS